jgi:hypothetical protein
MKAADVWTLVLGAVVALAGTLLAQWSSLAYQTRRQREARRADFQRSALVQVQDLLLELSEAMRSVATARYEATDYIDRAGGLPTYHPAVAAVRSITDRLEILVAAVEDEQLRVKVGHVARRAYVTAIAPTEELAAKTRPKSQELHREAVQLLGEQLRKLP